MSKKKQKNTPDKNNDQEIVVVEAKDMEANQKPIEEKITNIKIDRIGSLTLNVVSKPLKKRYEKHYKEDKMHLIVDVVLIAIIVILLGVVLNIWLFSKSKLINLVDFNVTSNPEQLINGQEVEFTINYTNTTKETLSDATLVLKIPISLHNPEFSASDFDIKTNTLKIGELVPKSHGEFQIKGLLLGNFDTKHEFISVINYKNKYGQDRQEFFRQNFDLNGSALQVNLILPKKTIANSPFETNLILKNTSNINFENIDLKMNWPDGYTLSSVDLVGETNNTWALGLFNTGQENNHIFTGKQYIKDARNINIQASIYATFDGQKYLLSQGNASTFVDFSKVRVNFTSLENNHSINPGGQTTYTVHYQNDEKYTVNNLEIGLNLNGEYAATNQVIVNQNTYKKLTSIEPGEAGTVELKASTKSAINYNRVDKNYQLQATAFITYDDPNEKSRITVESNPVVTKINSRLSLSADAYFYTPEGDQIGVGSVPPVVGEYTSYWLIIKAVNTNNKIKDILVTAKIPDNVEYTGISNVTAGSPLIFEESSRKFTWAINYAEPFAGIFSPPLQARIQIAIVPTPKQAGTSPALLTSLSGTATDEATSAFLNASGNNVTTAIFNDPTLNKVIE